MSNLLYHSQLHFVLNFSPYNLAGENEACIYHIWLNHLHVHGIDMVLTSDCRLEFAI